MTQRQLKTSVTAVERLSCQFQSHNRINYHFYFCSYILCKKGVILKQSLVLSSVGDLQRDRIGDSHQDLIRFNNNKRTK